VEKRNSYDFSDYGISTCQKAWYAIQEGEMRKIELEEFLNAKHFNPSIELLSLKVQKAIIICSLLKAYDLFENGSGWSLHILTEDSNIDDNSILFCLNQSIKDKNYIGEKISKLLLEFSEQERETLLLYHDPDDEEILTIDEIDNDSKTKVLPPQKR